nr:putative reverse transcriptase domain-containing protein [Tanacetum cinerariifolium]
MYELGLHVIRLREIVVTELKIVEWHNYKHLDWITLRRDDDKLYKFKEGDFKRLRIQDIEDMLLLLVQGKLTNLTVEERFSFNVSLRMITRSIVIQRFTEGFSKIAKSMTKLTQKKVKFDWGDKQEAAFQLLKEKLCSAPILALPERAENFIVYCDASHKGLGVVLMQNEKVIAYTSG